MGIEIERKFLLPKDFVVESPDIIKEITQGYISKQGDTVVRARTCVLTTPTNLYKNYLGYTTIKMKNRIGCEEWEFTIDYSDAVGIILRCASTISKTRYVTTSQGLCYEYDFFHGDLEGLKILEIEFEDESQYNDFKMPDFVLKDVTNDNRFMNSNLSDLSKEAAQQFLKEIYA